MNELRGEYDTEVQRNESIVRARKAAEKEVEELQEQLDNLLQEKVKAEKRVTSLQDELEDLQEALNDKEVSLHPSNNFFFFREENFISHPDFFFLDFLDFCLLSFKLSTKKFLSTVNLQTSNHCP